MGLEKLVTFTGDVPSWSVVRESLERLNLPLQMRMIDGELAFPDEVPPENWDELRVNTANGMITIRREPNLVRFIVWGNADASLLQARATLAQAFAEAGAGKISEQGD